MNPDLYEELCRRYVSDKYGVSLQEVTSERIPNPQRQGLPGYAHQIDLRWEIKDEVSAVVYIANAKWRGSDKVDQPEVMLLAKVCRDVGAHKAVMITSSGFTSGAVATAKHEGISLHIVKPNFDYVAIPKGNRAELQDALDDAATPGQDLYMYEVAHRAADAFARPTQAALSTAEAAGGTTRQVTNYTTRSGPGPGATNRSLGGPSGPSGRPAGGGGFSTRSGGSGSTRGGGGFERR